jgi:hypothetical protein
VFEGVLEILVTAVHLETDAFVNEHFVLALAWKLEAFVGVDDVLPNLWDFNLFHVEEFFGVEVLISFDAVVLAELKCEHEKLVGVLDQVIQYVNNFESHLLDLHQLRVRFGSFVLNLIDLVLGLDESLQKLRDLSAFECMVHF